MQEIIEDYIENNDVIFEMRVLVDGEPIVRYTSLQSFDDVASFAELADEAFNSYVLSNEQDRLDLAAESELETLMDDKRSRDGTL